MKSVENAGNIKENSDSILETLEYLVKQGRDGFTDEILAELREQAKSKLDSKALNLTKEATKEAESKFFDPKTYKEILGYLKNSNSKLFIGTITQKYNVGKIDLEKFFKERSSAKLASAYSSYKSYIDIEKLLLMNPGSEYLEEEYRKTTFIHELFSNSAPREDIISIFKKLNKLAELNPELMQNYLALSDSDGKPINLLLSEKSLEEKYLRIEEEIKSSCKSLYPEAEAKANSDLSIDTHTSSVHGSVDQSFVRLALAYNQKLAEQVDPRKVAINRDEDWQKNIERDLKEFERELEKIIASNDSIADFIKPSLIDGENKEEACNKFKFQAETALRMIKGLREGGYGRYRVSANEEGSCGLTPKEMVAIGYASLKDRGSWNNEKQRDQQFMRFTEALYISKRGYNIDAQGENEWKTPKEDDNKCQGGTINQIAYGLQDHKSVEIKIINVKTMRPSLSVKLADILIDISRDNPQSAELISTWLTSQVLDRNLRDNIIEKLCKNEAFSHEFSESEIKDIGQQVLNTFKKADLDKIREAVKDEIPIIINLTQQDIEMSYQFIFDANKGYIPYLEDLYNKDESRFTEVLQTKLSSSIIYEHLYWGSARDMDLMLSLLLVSQDENMANKAKSIFSAHLENFSPDQKDKYLLLAAAENHTSLVTALAEAGANINSVNNFKIINHAISNDNNDLLKRLKDLGTDINAKDDWGYTALHIAARSGKLDALELLIKSGADINAKNNSGYTALHNAAINGALDALELLIKSGADINAKNNSGYTALHNAAINGALDALAKLIKSGADINAKDYRGYTALYIAAERGKLDVLARLIDLGVNITDLDQNAKDKFLLLAAEKNDDSLVEKLVMAGANINSVNNFEIISHAISNHNNDLLKKLIDLGADINAKNGKGETFLHISVREGNPDRLAKLIELGAKINAKDYSGYTALHIAAINSKLDALELLIDLGADIEAKDREGHTALHNAAINGALDALAKLIDLGADINAKDCGYTALHIAAERGALDALAKLIESGADINAKDYRGYTALYIAAREGKLDVLARLIDLGVNITDLDQNAKDKFLLLAAEKNDDSLVEKLVMAGANINSVNNFEIISHAISNHNNDLLKKLIDLGADINAKNGKGETFLHISVREGNPDRLAKLIELGAKINAKDESDSISRMEAKKVYLNALVKLIDSGANIIDIDQTAKDKFLLLAAEKNDDSLVEKLVTAGANINAKDESGYTALHIATREGKLDTLAKLIESGADINAKDRHDNTALHIAAGIGKLYSLELLIKSGADIEAKDDKGYTALHIATGKAWGSAFAFYGADRGDQIGILKELIVLGADIDTKDESFEKVMDLMKENDDRVNKSLANRHNTSSFIVDLINKGSGYIRDDSENWKAVESIVNNINEDRRVKVISEVLNEIKNPLRRSRLLEFLPKDEQERIKQSSRPTVVQATDALANMLRHSLNYTTTTTPKRKEEKGGNKR